MPETELLLFTKNAKYFNLLEFAIKKFSYLIVPVLLVHLGFETPLLEENKQALSEEGNFRCRQTHSQLRFISMVEFYKKKHT